MLFVAVFCFCALTNLQTFDGRRAIPSDHSKSRVLLTVAGDDLTGASNEASAEAFDLSNDGQRLAVAFRRAEGPAQFSLWVGEWEIEKKKLIAKQEIQSAIDTRQLLPNAQYRLDLQFVPNSDEVVVQAGTRLAVLSASSLAPLRAIAAPATLAIRRFTTSADGAWLAVLSTTPTYSCAFANVTLYDIRRWAKVAEWTQNGICAKSLSLSPNGDRILLSRIDSSLPTNADVLLVNSRTGEILSTVDAAYGGHGPGYGANDARFMDEDRLVTLPNISLLSGFPLKLHTIKVWDARTGRLLNELHYSDFGVVGFSLAVARNAHVVAAVTNQADPKLVHRDDPANIGHPRLLLFHVQDTEPYYVSPPLRPSLATHSPEIGTSPLRISANASEIAMFEGRAVEVFQVSSTHGDAQNRAISTRLPSVRR